MSVSNKKRRKVSSGALASALLGAVADAVFWVIVPYLISRLFPIEGLGRILVIGGLIVVSGFIARLLRGMLVGSIFGALSDSLKIFLIFVASGWGTYSVNYGGYRVFVDATPIVALLTIPFILSLVDRFLSTGVFHTGS